MINRNNIIEGQFNFKDKSYIKFFSHSDYNNMKAVNNYIVESIKNGFINTNINRRYVILHELDDVIIKTNTKEVIQGLKSIFFIKEQNVFSMVRFNREEVDKHFNLFLENLFDLKNSNCFWYEFLHASANIVYPNEIRM